MPATKARPPTIRSRHGPGDALPHPAFLAYAAANLAYNSTQRCAHRERTICIHDTGTLSLIAPWHRTLEYHNA